MSNINKEKITVAWSDVLYDDEFLETLSSWHGGQSDPVYAVSSSLYAGMYENIPKSYVRDAIYNLTSTLQNLKKKHYKGYKRDEITELKYIISMLNRVYKKLPDDGSEDYND